MRAKHIKAQKMSKMLPMATAEIWSRIPEDLKDKLTAKELSLVMQAMNDSYHAGRTSTGAEKIDADCIWINGIGMMEIVEEGAEYETIKEEIKEPGRPTFITIKNVKTKPGRLIGVLVQ